MAEELNADCSTENAFKNSPKRIVWRIGCLRERQRRKMENELAIGAQAASVPNMKEKDQKSFWQKLGFKK